MALLLRRYLIAMGKIFFVRSKYARAFFRIAFLYDLMEGKFVFLRATKEKQAQNKKIKTNA